MPDRNPPDASSRAARKKKSAAPADAPAQKAARRREPAASASHGSADRPAGKRARGGSQKRSSSGKGGAPPSSTGWRGWAQRWLLRLRNALLAVIVAGTVLPAAQAALLNVLNPPLTLTMVGSTWTTLRTGGGLHLPSYRWVSLDQIPDHVVQAAISSEDARFFVHNGFDWEAIEQALDEYEPGESTAGGSSISQQTAKNVFLWQGRSWVRKGLEVWYTFWLELLVPKTRILEVYLNVAETGPLTFGVQAGAQRWFQKEVGSLTPDQSARLICILPAPTRWTVTDERVARRAGRIVARPSPIPPRWREGILPQPGEDD